MLLKPEDAGIGRLFWTIREAVIVADAVTDRILLWNRAAEEVFGYTDEEAVGLPTDVLIPPSYRAQHYAGMSHYHSTGQGNIIDSRQAIELPALHKSGAELSIELSLSRMPGAALPGDPVLAVIRDVTERRRARQELQEAHQAAEQALIRLREEQARAEALLLNVLPRSVADRLQAGEHTIADRHPDVTVLFADLVNFTEIASAMDPIHVVEWLNAIFSGFDFLAEQHGVEKIKTIGDAYMAAGGLPGYAEDHPAAVADLALAMLDAIALLNEEDGPPLQLRIGIHTGPVVAGVIGVQKFIYDLWGDTVNIGSRMESHGIPGSIQVSAATRARLGRRYRFHPRGPISIKGRGTMPTYLLLGRNTGK
jgi:PAS domain S-box-containing protein